MVGIDNLVTCCRGRREAQALRGLGRLFTLDHFWSNPLLSQRHETRPPRLVASGSWCDHPARCGNGLPALTGSSVL